MPDHQGTHEGKSRLFCLYMRPWALQTTDASPHVPTLAQLGKPRAYATGGDHKRRKLRLKQPVPDARQYSLAWRQYVRGGIVSHHQRRIIVQFMAANCGKNTTRDAAPADEAEEVQEEELDCARNMSVDRIHALLDDMAKHKQQRGSDQDADGSQANSKSFHANLAQQHKSAQTFGGSNICSGGKPQLTPA